MQQQVIVQQPVFQEAFVQHPQVVNTVVGVPVPVLYNAPIAQQGNTIYGYYQGANQVIQPNTVDLAVLYNQANRLAEQAQLLASQANSDFQNLVKLEAQNQQVLRSQAQGQINITLKIDNGQVSVQEPYRLMTQPKSVNCPDGACAQHLAEPPAYQAPAEPTVQPLKTLTLDSIINDKCYKCHSATNAKGGLSFDSPISVDMQREILDRITSDDPMLSMPRKADGSAAPKLDKTEIDVLYQAMGIKR